MNVLHANQLAFQHSHYHYHFPSHSLSYSHSLSHSHSLSSSHTHLRYPPIIFLLCSIYFRIPRLFPSSPPRAGRADNFSFSNSVSVRSLLHITCCTSRVTMASGGMEPGAFKTYDPTVHLYSTAPTLPSTVPSLPPKVWVCFTAPFHTP